MQCGGLCAMLCDCAALCATLATMLSVIRLVCRGPLLCYLLCCTPTLQHTRYQPTAPLSAISVMLSAMLLAMLPATLPAMLCAYTSLVPTSHTAVPVAQFLSEARGDGSWAFLRQSTYDPMRCPIRVSRVVLRHRSSASSYAMPALRAVRY
eukprot:1681933-Rhodomonas_salina.1